VGSLSGSSALWLVQLIDVFAWLESFAASKSFTAAALYALLPVAGIYLVFGRAFCGWVCPMDYLFEMVGRLKKTKREARGAGRTAKSTGYGIAAGVLVLSALTGIPVFTNYVSHLTNFFRSIATGFSLALDLPANPAVFWYSLFAIVLLLVIEYASPRLWCRALCPVGRVYGIFNKVSLLRLSFAPASCTGCSRCEEKCYMKVNIMSRVHERTVRDTNCIYCGRCVEECGNAGNLIRMTVRRKS
jgi:ferredoxin-type protein NapH